MTELKNVVNELNQSFEDFKNNNDSKLAEIQEQVKESQERLDNLELEQGRAGIGGAGSFNAGEDATISGFAPTRFAVDYNGNKLPVLNKSDRLSDYLGSKAEPWNIADYVRASMGMDVRNDVTTGPATVPGRPLRGGVN